MANDPEDSYGDDGRIGQLLRERLPRHSAPAHLRVTIAEAVSPSRPRRSWFWPWGAPAAAALAMAMVMLLVLAPSLPLNPLGDPVRLLSREVLNEHARTVMWGDERPDVVVPEVLPWAMEESGVEM